MKPSLTFLTWILIAGYNEGVTYSQEIDTGAPQYGSRYSEIKTWHEQRRALERTDSQLQNDARQLGRARYGNRGLDFLFKGFEGPGAIDLRIPGVESNLRLTTSDNRNVARGARRNHLYATQLYQDPRFQLLGINQPTRTPLGMTDKDIVYRHRASGTNARIEVKELSQESQRRNSSKLKLQIDKMAFAQRTTGERQAYVNRRELIPELKTHLSARGIPYYERVATGKTSLRIPGTQSMDHVLRDLDRRESVHARSKMFKRGGTSGWGWLLLVTSSRDAYCEWNALQTVENGQQGSLDGLGHHVSLGLAGTGMVLSDFSRRREVLSIGRRSMRGLTKFGGRAVPVMILAGEGFLIRQYQKGEISREEFWTNQSSLAGGFAGALGGAWAGSKAGATIGAWFGPGGAGIGGMIGGIAGGFAGGYAGSSVAEFGTHRHFQFKRDEDERAFRDFVHSTYGLTRP